MLDASTVIDEDDLAIIRLVENRKKVVVINKADLAKKLDKKSLSTLFGKNAIIEISVEEKRNIDELEAAIIDTIYAGKFAQSEGSIVTNARHKELLDKALNNIRSAARLIKKASHPELIVLDIKEAIFNLGFIIGRSVSDDVLDRVFENFCIGK